MYRSVHSFEELPSLVSVKRGREGECSVLGESDIANLFSLSISLSFFSFFLLQCLYIYTYQQHSCNSLPGWQFAEDFGMLCQIVVSSYFDFVSYMLQRRCRIVELQ